MPTPRVSHVARYVDMPLQHASNKVLKRMRRGIRRERIEKLLARFRDRVPDVKIRTTFLVGHPGEEEEDFEILKDFVRSSNLIALGCFRILTKRTHTLINLQILSTKL